jgi:predicted GTPase
MDRERVVIMGAAGRDFHDFNVVFRTDPNVEVVAFTAAQIPGIAGRRYPAVLAGELYPDGIAIVPEADLEAVIRTQDVRTVVFAYSDVSHETVMHAASRALAAGADFTLLGPDRTMLQSRRPVVAVGACRTAAGTSQTTRYLAARLAEQGVKPVMVRHPMPYGDLAEQRVERFATYDDLDRFDTTIEEREEYEPHIDAGMVVYAGVDYEAILRQAETEADVVLWDGGNNDFPFYRPDLFVVVVDPLRPDDEHHYHPGETNLRMADIVVINKVDAAEAGAVAMVRTKVHQLAPRARVVEARSELTLDGPPIAGKRVVVVEDGPTLTHGGMAYGAGIVAARRFGAGELVDPRPAAVGSILDVLHRYPSLEPLVPAMGYGPEQIHELEATLNAVDADLVLSATPIDLTRVLTLDKPITRVRYDLLPLDPDALDQALEPILGMVRAPVVAGG